MSGALPSLEVPAILELSKLQQWVCWKTVDRIHPVTKKVTKTKVPINPNNGSMARVNAPSTWGSYEKAFNHFVKSGDSDGVGFVFTKGDPYCGVDLDKCIEDGVLRPSVKSVAEKLSSYTEISPSGNGLHIIIRGHALERKRIPGFECYSERRFFTITGRLPESGLVRAPETIEERQDQLVEVWATLLGKHPVRQRPKAKQPTGDLEQLTLELTPHLSAEAEAPVLKLDILTTNSPTVLQTWDRTRKDGVNWSPSEWDMALANYFTAVSWSDVEIMHGLIHNRRKHGNDLKLRADYYARTILRAREDRDIEAADTALDHKTGEPLAHLSRIYGVEITEIRKYLSEPPEYEIRTARGNARGTIGILVNQTSFKLAIAEATAINLPRTKEGVWLRRSNAMLDSMCEIKVGEEATEAGQAKAWLSQYLTEHRAIGKNEEDALPSGAPFINSPHLYIVGSDFSRWLMRAQGQRVAGKRLGIMLKRMGATWEQRRMTKEDGSITTRSVWRLPKGWEK